MLAPKPIQHRFQHRPAAPISGDRGEWQVNGVAPTLADDQQ